MRNFPWALGWAFLLLAAVSCDSSLTKPSLYNTVRVVATRRNGDRPVPGVALVLYTGQRPMAYGVTDTSGGFTFTRVPQGLYGVLASVPAGYDVPESLVGGPPSTVYANLMVANDTLSPVHFAFLKKGPGSIAATITDSAGKPLGGVYARLFSPTRLFDSLPSDVNGAVAFTNVPFGVYGVVVTRPPGYSSFNRPDDSLFTFHDRIIVDEGAVVPIHFSLQRCSGRLRVHVTDQGGAAVPNVPTQLFTSSSLVASATTDQAGLAVYDHAPCLTILGTRLFAPPPGYAVISGRGTEFVDGISLSVGAVRDVTLVLRKQPPAESGLD